MQSPLVNSLTRLVWWTARRTCSAVSPFLDADDVAQELFEMLIKLERQYSDKELKELEKIARTAIRWHRNRLILNARKMDFEDFESLDVMNAKSTFTRSDFRRLSNFITSLSSIEQRYMEMLLTPSNFVSKEFEVFWRFGHTKSWASKMETRLKSNLCAFLLREIC